MYGSIITDQIRLDVQSLATGRKVFFDPRPLLKETITSPQAKSKQNQNVRRVLSSSRFRTLLMQLEKEINSNLIK